MAEVTRAVRAAGDGSSDTRAAGRVTTALDTLLTHLVRAHARCQDVADKDWAGGATAEREADIDRIIESVRAETTTP